MTPSLQGWTEWRRNELSRTRKGGHLGQTDQRVQRHRGDLRWGEGRNQARETFLEKDADGDFAGEGLTQKE